MKTALFMNQKFTKAEKLKRDKIIKELFSKGKRLKAYPLVLVYIKINLPEDVPVQAGFSVPKRIHKTAVARNRLKRLMRETYRKQKTEFYVSESTYAFMFIYTGKHRASYGEVQATLVRLIAQFNKKEHTINQDKSIQRFKTS